MFSPVLVYEDIVEVEEAYSVHSEDSAGEDSDDDDATVGDEGGDTMAS